jgi:hypothetical protein
MLEFFLRQFRNIVVIVIAGELQIDPRLALEIPPGFLDAIKGFHVCLGDGGVAILVFGNLKHVGIIFRRIRAIGRSCVKKTFKIKTKVNLLYRFGAQPSDISDERLDV